MPNEFRVKRGLIVETTGSITGSSPIIVDGVSGRLFTVVDSFSGSLFSVNTVAGLPVIEAFSDNTVRIGQHGQRVLYVSQSRVGIGKETSLNSVLDVSGSAIVSGSVSIGTGITLEGAHLQVNGYSDEGIIRIGGGSTSYSSLHFGDGSGAARYSGFVQYFHTNDEMYFGTAQNTRVTITSQGTLQHYRVSNRQTGNYTLALSDAGKIVEMNVGSANTVTVPSSSSVNFPTGSFIDVIQYGAGQTSFVTGSGVTIRSANGWLKINAQYGAATLTKIGGNEWYLVGNLSA